MELRLLVDIFTAGSSDKLSISLQSAAKLVSVGSCRVHLLSLNETRVRHPQSRNLSLKILEVLEKWPSG